MKFLTISKQAFLITFSFVLFLYGFIHPSSGRRTCSTVAPGPLNPRCQICFNVALLQFTFANMTNDLIRAIGFECSLINQAYEQPLLFLTSPL